MSQADAARPILPPRQSLRGRHRPARRHPAAFPDAAASGWSRCCCRRRCSGCCSSPRPCCSSHGVGIWGLNIPVNWAFAIHNYVWWLGIGHAGTLISALLLLLGRDWRNSLNRFAETMTLFAVICAGIYPILHLGRPWFFYWMFPYPATMEVWPQFRSPLEWDIWAVLTYLTVSIVFWYIGLVPDLAAARDRARRRGWQVFFGVLSLGWRGSAAHWMRWHQAYRLLAALAVPLVVSVHSEVSLLFAAGTIPGWHSTIFPPYFVLGAAFSGFAVVAMIAIALRSLFKLQNLVTDDHLDVLGKVLLACGLMTAYGYVFEVFDALYSGDAHEMQTLSDRFSGEYAWSYWGAVIFNFVVLQPLWWRSVRRTPWMLFAISTSVAIGMWLERYMILVTSLYRDFLVSSWGEYHADVLGLGDLCRHHRAVLRAVPPAHPAAAGDLDLRDQGGAARRKEGAASWPHKRLEHYGLLAEFETPEALVEAAKRARDEGYRDLDAFTPFPVYELFPVLRLRDRRVLWLGLFGGIFGCALAFAMQTVHQLRLSDQRRRPAALRAVGFRGGGLRADRAVRGADAGDRHAGAQRTAAAASSGVRRAGISPRLEGPLFPLRAGDRRAVR